jgi:serine/threonine protein kinase
MTLASGSHLGPYQILSKLGEGGMGQVYRARDTSLGRDVAIKVIQELFAADPERLARFKREAQVLASLNHPNIGAIHGLQESDGVRALVLELVEGLTLQQRLEAGDLGLGRSEPPRTSHQPQRPLPVDEALNIARQIATALEAAHECGIVHRDLKPANI